MKEFKTERNVKWPWSPTVKSGEQAESSNRCPSPVKFVAAIPICKIAICRLSGITTRNFQCCKVTAQLPATTITEEQSKRPFLFISFNFSKYGSLTVWKTTFMDCCLRTRDANVVDYLRVIS